MASSPALLVGIVVLNYNGEACLLQCLRSLERLRYPKHFVIVVDNASSDGSLEAAEREFPEHTYIRSAENNGFAAGMNIGMQAVFARGASFAWLFNNDATPEPDALGRLLAVALSDKRIGLLSPFIFQTGTKRLWFGKGRIDMLRMRALHVAPSRLERRKECFESAFLTGCALLIRKDVYEKVGALDERFFLYYEDADYALRARKEGFLVVAVPKARVFHAEQSEENPRKLYHLVRSGLLFCEKHALPWQRPYFSAYATLRRLKNSLSMALGSKKARVVRQAYDDYYGQ